MDKMVIAMVLISIVAALAGFWFVSRRGPRPLVLIPGPGMDDSKGTREGNAIAERNLPVEWCDRDASGIYDPVPEIETAGGLEFR